MTTLTIFLRRQASRTVSSPRRLLVVVLLLAIMAAAGLATLVKDAPATNVVTYDDGIKIIAPVEREVCRGGEVLFPVKVVVTEDSLPNQGEIAESWCRPGETGGCIGVQPANLREGAKRLPLVKPRRIETVSSRTVPMWLGLGDWEFWHTIQDKDDNVEGYSVEPITVVDCAAP